MKINAAGEELTQALGHAPTVAELAAHLGVGEDEVLDGLEGARAHTSVSLSTPIGEESSPALSDMLGGDDHDLELAELHIALGSALTMLDRREKLIISLRFYGNLTQAEIARSVGISQMHVSRLISRALDKLHREMFDEQPPPELPPVRSSRR
jgi:RNA polymerase sigma-B factor